MYATGQLGTWDIVVIAAYFVFVFAIGIYSTFRANRGNVRGYFLAGRMISWWPVGLSLFASNIGSEHLIGLAGKGASSGLASYLFEGNAIYCLLMLGWAFLPVYISSSVYTIPEYLSKRFGGQRLRVCLTAYALLLYVFVKVSVDLFAGAIFIQQALRWNLYVSVAFILGVTALFTVVGGLTAVIYMDSLQSFIMIIGAIILTVLSYIEIGSYENLQEMYMDAIPNSTRYGNTTCGMPRDDAFHMVRHPIESDWPFPGLLFRSTVISIWYWCADQVIVQRALAAKSLHHARGGTVLAGYLKILPLFLLMFPGMISRALWPEEVACADPDICKEVCDSSVSCSNIAYPKLILELMPEGLRGLMMAVMLSALMSSLTSIFNSASTIFTLDVWKRIRKGSSQREQLIVGKIFVVTLAGVGILWIPIMMTQEGGQLMEYIWAITSYLASPITALFLAAVFWPRANEKGSFWGFIIGLTIGITRMILSFVYPDPPCGEEDTRNAFFTTLHHSYFSLILFLFCILIIVVVSVLTDRLPEYRLHGTTFFTRHVPFTGKDENADEDAVVIENEMVKEVQGPDDDCNSNAIEMDDIKTDVKNDIKTDVKNDIKTEVKPDSEEKEHRDTSEEGNPSAWKRIVGWFCGTAEAEDDPDVLEAKEAKLSQLRADNTKPIWKYILNINAVLLMAIELAIIIIFR
ncbi:sodium/mannose cotransporter SLC5A10-like [Ptychodera flava]|uniref:sodium/mannose cotransporter SLC5A10-like n=1 Tax=Ptychodera flava TaxID=63121 RepID=UPI00396A338B